MKGEREVPDVIQRVLDLLENVRPSSNGWTALCPAHDDNRSSLSIAQGNDGRVLFKCFAGCEATDIVAALGITMVDLFSSVLVSRTIKEREIEPAPLGNVEATYPYRDELGDILYEVVRYEGKVFRPRRPGDNGTWIPGIQGVRRVPYNLPDIITATNVIVVEGEKDAESVKRAFARFENWKYVRGWAVTTCAFGGDGWRPEYAPYFAGKAAYILPDNDDTGRKFAQNVANSVSSLARKLKIIELPDLPEKGDVSDYLADHNATDLQDELRKAPVFKRKASQIQLNDASTFNVQWLRDYFDEPDELQSWLVEDLLPAGGMSLLAGKPKAGKSTLARQLAFDVSLGNRFLGRPTQRGKVIYLALEEKRQEVKQHFRDIGATGDEPLLIHCAPAPQQAMEQARLLVKEQSPKLLIIDPLFKFARVRDGNDYTQVTSALEPILALARETDTHVLCVHHCRKGQHEDPADTILGSTAIFANVDTAMLLTRYDKYRTITSRQRYGPDLEESVLEFNAGLRTTKLGSTRDKAEVDKIGEEIMAFLRSNPEALEQTILESITGRKQKKVTALRGLIGTRIKREGKGGKRDPYRYSCSPEGSSDKAGTRTADKAENPSKREIFVVPGTAPPPRNKNRAGEGDLDGTGG